MPALTGAALLEATSAAGATGAAAGGLGGILGGGGGALLGGAVAGLGSLLGTTSANAANRDINRETMAWEERMSNTAVQRRSQDMIKAGINPILAAGNPASQPGYNPLAMQSTGGAAATAIQSAAQAAQIENIKADTHVKEAQAGQITSSTYGAGQFPAQAQAGITKDIASAGASNAAAAAATKSIDEMGARIQNLEQLSKGKEIENRYLPALQDLQKQMAEVTVQLQRLKVPEAQAIATGFNKVNEALSATGVDKPGFVSNSLTAVKNAWSNFKTWADSQRTPR